MNTLLERAAAYLERMPPAIAGSGGHPATFNVAAALTRGFAMTEQDALPLLMAWNQTHCQPPWTESELRHKLRSAASSTRPLGYLLDEAGARRDNTAPDFENEAEKKARQRKAWPEFMPLKPAGITAIATLRHIPPDGVYLAHLNGFLKEAVVDGHRCFIVHEGSFAQARRMDGGLLDTSKGPSKTKNLLGSEGAFIGQRLLGNAPRVLLVEGAFGLIEALTAFAHVNMAGCWSVLAATSAYSRFARDRALLARLRGRYVRILPDAGETGMDAAASWLADLRTQGATVQVVPVPEGCEDLGDILSNPEVHAEALNSLFQ